MNIDKDYIDLATGVSNTQFRHIEDHSLLFINDQMEDSEYYTERKMGCSRS